MALIICDLYGFSHEEIDMNPKLFLKYSKKVNRIFRKVEKRYPIQWRLFETNAQKITFGQFIEVQYFLSNGLLDNLHFIAASIRSNGNEDFMKRAEKLLDANIRSVLPDVKEFLESFQKLISSYSGLFDNNEEVIDEDEPLKPAEDKHPFLTQYGWLYSARQVAKDLGLKLDDAFKLPILEALNTLAYLKSEQSYIKHMSK
jgi:hypothetical protein